MASPQQNNEHNNLATTSTASSSNSTGTGTGKNQNKNNKTKSKATNVINLQTNDTTELIKTIPNELIETKFDEVIENVIQIDNTCCFTKCKQKTNLMGVDCQYCKNKFCFKHGLPEVHGCGAAVKVDERKKFLHPIPEKTKREQADLKKAHATLNTKLKDMQISRLPKQQNNADKKKKKKKPPGGTDGCSGCSSGGAAAETGHRS